MNKKKTFFISFVLWLFIGCIGAAIFFTFDSSFTRENVSSVTFFDCTVKNQSYFDKEGRRITVRNGILIAK